jgi:hypothetical protein
MLFAIRGIGFDTIGAIIWSRSASRLPIMPRPPLVQGDGFQPAWGSRLAALPLDQCITVSEVEHMFLCEHHQTQQALARLL